MELIKVKYKLNSGQIIECYPDEAKQMDELKLGCQLKEYKKSRQTKELKEQEAPKAKTITSKSFKDER